MASTILVFFFLIFVGNPFFRLGSPEEGLARLGGREEEEEEEEAGVSETEGGAGGDVEDEKRKGRTGEKRRGEEGKMHGGKNSVHKWHFTRPDLLAVLNAQIAIAFSEVWHAAFEEADTLTCKYKLSAS